MKKRILFIISFFFLAVVLFGVIKPSLISDEGNELRTSILSDFQAIRVAAQNYIAEDYLSDFSNFKISNLVKSEKGYLRMVPADPWNKEYNFFLDENGNIFIVTFGEDGVEGGVDRDADFIELLVKR